MTVLNRRSFVRISAAATALSTIAWRPQGPGPVQEPDLILRGATVFDGTGASAREVDVAITGDRIVALGQVPDRGGFEIDLRGLALAPGFIDIHSHADLSLLVNPKAESRIRQGITTEVAGQDGSSVGPWSDAQFEETRDRYRLTYGVELDFKDLGGFLDRLTADAATVNFATMIGHGTIRSLVVGMDDEPATASEIESMAGHVAEGVRQGAVGLSSGLEYTPGSFAHKSELVELAKVLTGTGLPYASHMRNEDDELMAAVEEALHVGQMAQVPVQISHLKAQGQRNWWKAEAVLRSIEEARSDGLDVHLDRYPYVAYATGLSNLFPTTARRGGNTAFLERLADARQQPDLERACRAKVALLGSWDAVQVSSTTTGENRWAEGRRVGELARERGEDPFQLIVRLLIEERGAVGMIGFGMSEENTARILSHPLGMVCSDGGAYAPYGALSESSPHPRSYGTFPRFLGRYVRERGDLTLEDAIRKITSMPADKIGLVDRGRVRVGAFADLVAFDPRTIADQATFTDPHQYPAGIHLVIVNGVVALRDGEHVGEPAGRPLRGGGYLPR